MIDILIGIVGVITLVFAGLFAFMSAHLVEEKKQGKRIPLPWEKK